MATDQYLAAPWARRLRASWLLVFGNLHCPLLPHSWLAQQEWLRSRSVVDLVYYGAPAMDSKQPVVWNFAQTALPLAFDGPVQHLPLEQLVVCRPGFVT